MTAVVLTRPQADSERLSQTLQSEGFQTRVMPIMTIEAIPDAERALSPSLSDDALCIFVSANAVRFGLPQLGPDLARCPDLTVIAVGNKTRDTLVAEGIQAQVPFRADSEGLLAMPALSAPDARDVVIVKGEGGRELLASELTRRGARVTEWVCYRRCWPDVDVSELAKVGDGLIFQASSGEALAGVGLGGYTSFIAISMVIGLGAGVQAMVARRKGERDRANYAVPLNAGLVLGLAPGSRPSARFMARNRAWRSFSGRSPCTSASPNRLSRARTALRHHSSSATDDRHSGA